MAKEEALLFRLDSEREQAFSRPNALKQQLTELETECAEWGGAETLEERA